MPPLVRVWKGYGTAEGVDRYCRQHFREVVLPQLRALSGLRGAKVLVRSGDETEVLVATTWDSLAVEA